MLFFHLNFVWFLRFEWVFQQFLFFVSGIVEDGAEVFSYELRGFLRPELFFQ